MPTLHLDALSTTALALLLLALGSQLKKRSRWLTRLCVPSPVIAGFGFAFLVWLLRDRGWLDIGLDTSLQTPLMVAFFTTVGLGGSLGLLRKGGKTLLVYLSACWALAILQNLIGVGSAGLLGLDPLLGIMAGAVSLEGGFGAAAAFGPVAEGLGAQGATTVALASATFGMSRWRAARQPGGALADRTQPPAGAGGKRQSAGSPRPAGATPACGGHAGRQSPAAPADLRAAGDGARLLARRRARGTPGPGAAQLCRGDVHRHRPAQPRRPSRLAAHSGPRRRHPGRRLPGHLPDHGDDEPEVLGAGEPRPAAARRTVHPGRGAAGC